MIVAIVILWTALATQFCLLWAILKMIERHDNRIHDLELAVSSLRRHIDDRASSH
jgi:hypothetical protein